MKIKVILTIVAITCIALYGEAQVTYSTNNPNANPVPLGFLGWNDTSNEDLLVRQNNRRRMRFTSITWPGYNTVTPLTNVSRIFLSLRGTPLNGGPGATEVPAFSLLHMGTTVSETFSRPWMNVGTTYTTGGDIMYTGLLESPGAATNGNFVDAVVAWGDNENGNGPDNLRFLFLRPTGTSSSASATEGRETMRITPQGNIGMGSIFNIAQPPSNRLEVHNDDGSPQMRLSHTYDDTYAEFQMSENGNLHIVAGSDNTARTVAIGFFDDPSNATDPFFSTTKLDVGGRVRVRDLPIGTPEALIIGYTISDINDGPEDQYLGRLDFLPVTEQDPCIVLSSNGQWENVCEVSGACRWQDVTSTTVGTETDMFTGVNLGDPNCDRGKIGIGVSQVTQAKLEVSTVEVPM